MNKIIYVVITPVRNEAEYIEKTLSSMIKQTIIPVEWIIVDDGSTDNTSTIIKQFNSRHPWIKLVSCTDRGYRKSGGGVIEAFNQGLRNLTISEFEFIVKLDGDLSFNPDYFERCFEKFYKNGTLGIGGGKVVDINEVHSPVFPKFHVRGATKIYRTKLWENMGGLFEVTGWDTLDELKANMLGWSTQQFDELILFHYRPTGAYDGYWKSNVKYGIANYICGYHPLFMFIKFLRRLILSGHPIQSIGLLFGYLSGYLRKTNRINDKQLIKYVRSQQIKRLLYQKSIWYY